MSFSNCLTMRFDALGLPLPQNIKVTVPAAIASVKVLADFVERYGTQMDFRMAAGVIASAIPVSSEAAIISEIATILGAAAATVTVSFYLGALITSCVYCGLYRNDPEFASINHFLHSNHIFLTAEMKNCLIANKDTFNQMSGGYRLA